MLLACVTLDLMDKERSYVLLEDCSLHHMKRIFERPLKPGSSQALCWTLEMETPTIQIFCFCIADAKYVSIPLSWP